MKVWVLCNKFSDPPGEKFKEVDVRSVDVGDPNAYFTFADEGRPSYITAFLSKKEGEAYLKAEFTRTAEKLEAQAAEMRAKAGEL